ncbi:beta-lactamase family protein [Rheinheimera sp. YQF-2]|uniref:Beta-lactamase family protein n=1 Tax=Rheinheimera lutimaris TaxID=2740584 RepID=A0A7Y5ELS5_9GAMM|nr:serine hydrolase domain-containing protein [Rheinheimera lutimaris]NRQ43513.1 beta-lactamase family protein [Rheinheimera lutimaris]
MRKKIIVALMLLLLAGAYAFLQPVYQFFSHKGGLPMPFWGFVSIAEPVPELSRVLDNNYREAADTAMQQLKTHRRAINSPGISAAVAIEGKLVWQGVAGWADIAAKKPISPQTQFRIGSTSKALTSTLLARMVQQGNIELDTPLQRYKLSERNPAWRNITPRQLASHMAGIPHYDENTDWRGLYKTIALTTRYQDVGAALAVFDDSKMLFLPGEQFSYSSLGTVLLSAVMQEAGKTRYAQLMQTQVFAPLGMTDTAIEPEIGATAQDTAQLARFYWRKDESKPVVRVWRDVDLSHRLAAGGFISTSTDLVKLGLGFLRDDFVAPAIRQQFWTPQQLNNGEVNEQQYAIGWRVRDYDFAQPLGVLFTANHGGVSRGAQSWLMVIPEFNMVVAANINTTTEHFWDFGKVSTELVRAFLLARQQQTLTLQPSD